MKDIGKRVVALFVVLLVAGLLVRYGGAALSFVSGLVPTAPSESRVASGTVYTATPGKGACGILLGGTQESVRALFGWPDRAVDYAVTANWRYGPVEDYDVGVFFDSDSKYEEGIGSWKVWRVSVVHCFLPSVMGSIRTGVSDRASVVAAFGEPENIVYWDDDKDKITDVLLIYEKRDFAVALDPKTNLVNGFIVLADDSR